jgi:hypothetical protein
MRILLITLLCLLSFSCRTLKPASLSETIKIVPKDSVTFYRVPTYKDTVYSFQEKGVKLNIRTYSDNGSRYLDAKVTPPADTVRVIKETIIQEKQEPWYKEFDAYIIMVIFVALLLILKR